MKLFLDLAKKNRSPPVAVLCSYILWKNSFLKDCDS